MSDSSDDDDTPQLSAQALAALQEFYTEQQDQVQLEEQAREDGDNASKTGILQEDWVSCPQTTIPYSSSNSVQWRQPSAHMAVVAVDYRTLLLLTCLSTW